MNDTTDVLDRLPKATPMWAVGLTSIIIAATVSFVTVYVATKTEIVSYIQHNDNLADRKQDEQISTIKTVLDLAQSNGRQIATLSENLLKAQNDNLELTKRVGSLEVKIVETNGTLTSCLAELELCKKR